MSEIKQLLSDYLKKQEAIEKEIKMREERVKSLKKIIKNLEGLKNNQS